MRLLIHFFSQEDAQFEGNVVNWQDIGMSMKYTFFEALSRASDSLVEGVVVVVVVLVLGPTFPKFFNYFHCFTVLLLSCHYFRYSIQILRRLHFSTFSGLFLESETTQKLQLHNCPQWAALTGQKLKLPEHYFVQNAARSTIGFNPTSVKDALVVYHW